MIVISTARIARSSLKSTSSDLVLPFLAPAIHRSKDASCTSVARFSTSPASWKGDNNKARGLSALRHTGPRKRQTLSVIRGNPRNGLQLPKPVTPETQLQGDADHGLWDFFRDKKLLRTPADESRHGRAWTVPKLRTRRWEDLHCLWWVCVKERNRLATEKLERARLKAGYGDQENMTRDETIEDTMKAILDTLLERQTAWKEAYGLAGTDPAIDLGRTDGSQLRNDLYDTEELDDHQEGEQNEEDKELPEQNFFNTQENPPSLKDRVKRRAEKFLYNR